MKVKATKQIAAELQRLLDEQTLDQRMSNDISNFVEENAIIVDDGTQTADLKSDAERIGFAFDIIAKCNRIFESPVQEKIVRAQVQRNGRVFDASNNIFDNAYLKNVHLDKGQSGRFQLKWSYYQPYQVFSYNTPAWVPGGYFTVPALGYFTERFLFPYFVEEGAGAWMSITPNEICTMEEPLKRARGKVLTLGCGMGYFAYMAAIKDNVESVTIVEREAEVIQLFKNCILPHFPEPERITVVQADAYEYMRNLEDGTFDFCFADTWIGGNSVVEYLDMRAACAHLKRTEMSYWIEDSFLRTLVKLAGFEAVDAYSRANGNPVPQRRLHEDLLEPQHRIRQMLAGTVIPTPRSLQRLMSREGILELLNNS